MCRSFYLDHPCLTVIGKPSSNLADKLDKETKDRLEKTKARLGADGLERLGQKLKDAQKSNDTEIPPEMLSRFKVPSVDGIRWLDVKSAAAGTNSNNFPNEVQYHLAKDEAKLPYFIQFERTL